LQSSNRQPKITSIVILPTDKIDLVILIKTHAYK